LTPERWRQITATFHAALTRDPATRDEFLAEACAADPDLRAEVDALLAAHRGAGSFGERPVLSTGDLPTLRTDGPEAPRVAPTRRHPFRRVLWAAGAVTLAVLGYAALRLARDGGTEPAFGWTERSGPDGCYVEGVEPAGPAAGRLQPGDRIVALDGVAPRSLTATIPHRHPLSAGDRYTLTIVRQRQESDVILTVGSAPSSIWYRLTHVFVSLVWFVVGLFIGRARPEQAVARLACIAALATGLAFLEERVIHSGVTVAPLQGVLGFHFFCRFPDGASPLGLWRGALRLLYAIAGTVVVVRLWLVVAVLAGRAVGPSHWSLFELSPGWDLGTFAAAVIGILAVIPYRYRRLTDDDQRRRIRWVVYGSSLALVPDLWYLAVNFVEGRVGPGLALLANTSSLAIPLSLAYAVVKHRVLDIKVVVRRGVRYLLARRALQAAVALPLAVLAYTVVAHRHRTIAEIVSENRGYLFWVVAAAAGLRFRRPLQSWLDRRFFREPRDAEQLLFGLLDDVGRLDSVAELSRLVASKLDSALHPKTLYVWYRDPAEFAAASSAEPLLVPPDFPSTGSWLAWLESRGQTAPLPAPAEAALSRDEVRWFAEREVVLIVPMNDSSERVVGALLLGEKKAEEPYSEADRRLLQAMARQTAVVRENLRLRARVSEDARLRRDVLAKLDGSLPGLLKECPACGVCFDGAVETCERDGQGLVLSLPVARTIDGRYRLQQSIGKGGMGAVYEALDLRLGRTVAVKILLSQAFGQPTALRRFRREAQAAARLNHPSIVSVYDFGPLEGQGAYLVMERVSGTTLRTELDRRRRLSPATVAEWMAQILDGLAAAHARGIVHRDLKPENVIGRPADAGRLTVKILDFGLAKLAAAELPASGTVTTDGAVMGTLAYMSPEQLLGRDVDHRTDIFAVGVMLAEALTGRRPFDVGNGADLSRTLPPGHRFLPDAPPQASDVEALLRKCLARDPRDRYLSATALRDALIPALRSLPQSITA
jgi:GAF domain-containing protein